MIKLVEVAYYNKNIRCFRDGRIERLDKRCKNPVWREVPQTSFNKKGYLNIGIDGRNELWHRVVWIAFNGEIPNSLEINHIDEDKSNNSLDNLELLTHGDNIRHGTRTKRIAEANTNGKLSKPVIGINIKTGEKVEFPSTMEAGRNGFSQGAVASCCKGERKSHHGYRWFYKDQISS